jgi:ribosomal protein L11 methyltransferase
VSRAPELPRRWLVVSCPAPPAAEAHLAVDALRRLGARAVERQGDRVVAWLPPPARLGPFLARLAAALRASTSLADPDLTWHWESHDEWAARRDRGPGSLVAGRIAVVRAGEEHDPEPGQVVVQLGPAPAFGTAEHPTTRACLGYIGDLVRPGCRVADIGTGSGILAIAAVLLGAASAVAIDSDEIACAAARANAILNGVAGRIEIRHVRATPSVLHRLGRFDLVVANLSAETIVPLFPALRSLLTPDGRLVMAGVLGLERAAVAAEAAAAGLQVVSGAETDGWWAGCLARAR